MLSSAQWELRRPKDDRMFEEMTRDLFAAHWRDSNAQINGRPGQSQDGVDVYGMPQESGLWFGIQCKLREEGNLSERVLRDEIAKARGFRHKLDTFVFVTTLPRDTSLQQIVEQLNATEVENDSFKVQIRFWQDFCSLLDEHPRLIDKYYSTGGHPQKTTYQLLEKRPAEITPASPLLIGIVVDLSRSMINTLGRMPKSSGISASKIYQVIGLIGEKAVAYCKTPEANDVLPRFSLFLYGYGFGRLRQEFNSFLWRIGIRSQQIVPALIPADPVRDLFAEIAARESLPFTPNAHDMNLHWDKYRQSVEAQFLDIGSDKSILYDALCEVKTRFYKELERTYYTHPFLLIISDGNLDNAEDEDLDRVVREIKCLGVRIICFFINGKNVTEAKRLYVTNDLVWPQAAARLFRCSSIFSDTNHVERAIAEIAEEKGWQIPETARWFIQVNHSQMLGELVELLLTPLKG